MARLVLTPESSVDNLHGVGPKLSLTLQRLGIYRIVDLLLHLPMRYQDRTRITPLQQVRGGEHHLVEGAVHSVQVLFGKRRSLNVVLDDGTGRVNLRFFHFNKYQQNSFNDAQYVRAFGEFRFFGRDLTVAHPEYETFHAEPEPPVPALTPVYPTTQGLGQAKLRKLLGQVCDMQWPDEPGMPFTKLTFLHQPPSTATPDQIDEVQRELAIDELTAYYLVMKGRALRRHKTNAIPLLQGAGRGRELLDRLGFRLTQAQARVVAEVLGDLDKKIPMLRLVQGDVGSGKTIIAAFAAIRAAEHGCQTAIMAPTELLAEQHYLNFSNWLTPMGISTVLLSGAQRLQSNASDCSRLPAAMPPW